MRMEAGMALRALSANNFLSFFLFLGGFFAEVEERDVVLDGEVVVVDDDLVFVFDCCFELLDGDFFVLGLLRLREISESDAPCCCCCCCGCSFLDLLRDWRPSTDADTPDDSFGRTLLEVLRLMRLDDS